MINYQLKIKKISSAVVQERIKYLQINLTKKVKDLYTNNYIEKIEKTQINGKTFHAHGLEEYC